MTVQDPKDECQWCERLASVSLRGHWTLFDWFDVQVCDEHFSMGFDYLGRKRIDGAYPIQIEATPYWLQGDLIILELPY